MHDLNMQNRSFYVANKTNGKRTNEMVGGSGKTIILCSFFLMVLAQFYAPASVATDTHTQPGRKVKRKLVAFFVGISLFSRLSPDEMLPYIKKLNSRVGKAYVCALVARAHFCIYII